MTVRGTFLRRYIPEPFGENILVNDSVIDVFPCSMILNGNLVRPQFRMNPDW